MDKVHIGTMGWSYDFWIGNFYPKGLEREEFLSEYSKHFNTVEVDRTFYGLPFKETILGWKEQTPKDFLFSVKFPRAITHEKMLKNCEEYVKRFIERVSLLQGKLGPLLIQLPPKFKPDNIHLLDDFLAKLPKGFHFVVEVRNKRLLQDEVYSILKKNGVALALVDHPFMPKIEQVTADFIYVRFEGDRRKVKGTLGNVEIDRTNDVKRWADEIRKFLDLSAEVFGYFSKYYSGHPPTDAKQLLSLL
jgi:uncharacterized protein YecE (DUF72 family)